MIIGNGLLANAFKKYDNKEILIFASGVSNSLENRLDEFSREKNLLEEYQEKFKDVIFIYFGTCSIYDPGSICSGYVRHKISMEEIIKKRCSRYLIVRLPQIVGRSNNNNTLVNYLYRKIINRSRFDLWGKAIRYIIDIDDVVKFVLFINNLNISNKIINLSTIPANVADIVFILEKITGIKALYNIIDKGSEYSIPILDYNLTAINAGIEMDENYIERVLYKYYCPKVGGLPPPFLGGSFGAS